MNAQGYVQIMHIRNAQHRHSLHTCDVHICDAPTGLGDTCVACALYKTHGNAEGALPLGNPGPCTLLSASALGSFSLACHTLCSLLLPEPAPVLSAGVLSDSGVSPAD